MNEVEYRSVKLAIGASVYLGEDATWGDYLHLYHRVYNGEVWDKLQGDGYFVVIQTDQYKDSQVVARNAMLLQHLKGWSLVDEKVWERKKSDFYQPPFSMVWVLCKDPKKAPRPPAKGNPEYFAGVWRFPQTAGGRLNAYPDGLCRLLINTFTKPGDTILDPFAGTARLLGLAGRMGRTAIGYEIDPDLKDVINQNLNPGVGT